MYSLACIKCALSHQVLSFCFKCAEEKKRDQEARDRLEENKRTYSIPNSLIDGLHPHAVAFLVIKLQDTFIIYNLKKHERDGFLVSQAQQMEV